MGVSSLAVLLEGWHTYSNSDEYSTGSGLERDCLSSVTQAWFHMWDATWKQE